MVNQRTIIECGVLVEFGTTFVYPNLDQNAKLEIEVRYALVVGIQITDVKSVWPGTNYRACWNSAWCKDDGGQQTLTNHIYRATRASSLRMSCSSADRTTLHIYSSRLRASVRGTWQGDAMLGGRCSAAPRILGRRVR